MLVAELSVTYSMLGEESDSFLLSLTFLAESDLETPLLTSLFSVRLEEPQMLYEDEVDEDAPVRMETQPTPLKGPMVGAKCCNIPKILNLDHQTLNIKIRVNKNFAK